MKTLTLDSHGARIRIRVPDDVAAPLRAAVAAFTRVGDGGPVDEAFVVVPEHDGRFGLRRRGGRVEMVGTRDEVVVGVVDRLHPLVSQNARSAMFVHAAVFAFDDAVVVVPGRSHSGKSSLVAAALAQGARYFSDEFAVLDDDGMVHPYARPLSLRRPGGGRRFATAAELGGVTATGPARPTLVVSTSYQAGARWDPRTVEGSQAALPLIDNTVRARAEPRRMLRVAGSVVRHATTLVGPRGDAAETVTLIRERVARIAGAVPA